MFLLINMFALRGLLRFTQEVELFLNKRRGTLHWTNSRRLPLAAGGLHCEGVCRARPSESVYCPDGSCAEAVRLASEPPLPASRGALPSRWKRAADPCGGKASTAAPHLSQWACVAPVLISAALARGCSTCNIYSEVLRAKAICHLCEQCSLDLCAICHCARRAWGALFRLCTHRSAERAATFSSAVKIKTCPVCLRRERTPICIVVQSNPFAL